MQDDAMQLSPLVRKQQNNKIAKRERRSRWKERRVTRRKKGEEEEEKKRASGNCTFPLASLSLSLFFRVARGKIKVATTKHKERERVPTYQGWKRRSKNCTKGKGWCKQLRSLYPPQLAQNLPFGMQYKRGKRYIFSIFFQTLTRRPTGPPVACWLSCRCRPRSRGRCCSARSPPRLHRPTDRTGRASFRRPSWTREPRRTSPKRRTPLHSEFRSVAVSPPC